MHGRGPGGPQKAVVLLVDSLALWTVIASLLAVAPHHLCAEADTEVPPRTPPRRRGCTSRWIPDVLAEAARCFTFGLEFLWMPIVRPDAAELGR